MDDVETLGGIYDYLIEDSYAPTNLDDLLRSKIVCSVSAFDKLMHDIIHAGIVAIYSGKRASTPKYLNEPIALRVVAQLDLAEDAPRKNILSQAIHDKLRAMSFQSPDKVAEGLSYIWPESRKWKLIATAMGEDEGTVRSTLTEIVTRRNAIAHEADAQAFRTTKRSIDRKLTGDFSRFLRQLGETIHELAR